jgi:subtilisin family serine protease
MRDHGPMRHQRPFGPLILLLTAVFGALASVGWATSSRADAPVVTRENPADARTYDPYYSEQWALAALNAPEAWLRSTGRGVKVGVVDTGVDLAHVDLVGKVVASVSCVGAGEANPCAGSAQDDEGHGTHVAGIIAADTLNGVGVAGVAPGAVLIVAKALDANGSGSLGDVNAAIRWVVDHGAQIVNLSLEADGTAVNPDPGHSLADGVEYAWQHGAIPVVAAGNATPSLFGPGGYAGVDAVVVGATGRTGQPAWYSSPLTGAKWGVVAPGGDARGPGGTASCAGPLASGCIVSTGWFGGHANAYAVDEGTSMAAPQVAGVLALLLGEGLGPKAAIARLLATADPVRCGSGCAGAANAARAVGASPLTSYATAALPPATSAATPPPRRVASRAAPTSIDRLPSPEPPPARPASTTSSRPPRMVAPGRTFAVPVVEGVSSVLPSHPGRDPKPWTILVAVVLLLVVGAQAMSVVVQRQRR